MGSCWKEVTLRSWWTRAALGIVVAAQLAACAASPVRLPTSDSANSSAPSLDLPTQASIEAENPPAAGAQCLVYEEMVAGMAEITMGDLSSQDTFCYQYASGETVDILQRQAITQIQSFVGVADLALTFQAIGDSLNAPEPLRVAIFADRYGSQFQVEVTTWRVVGVDMSAYVDATAALSPLTSAQLRARAEDLLTANTPNFAAIRDRLSYEEGVKGDIHFFSWDDLTYQGWQFMPPMARLGLMPDGRLVSYINSLFLTN